MSAPGASGGKSAAGGGANAVLSMRGKVDSLTDCTFIDLTSNVMLFFTTLPSVFSLFSPLSLFLSF